MTLIIGLTMVNKTGSCIFGEVEPYEVWTDDIGELFKSLQKEHGRCTGKSYVDLPNGGHRQIGWVFEKRVRYQDGSDTYLQEAWVNVYTSYEERVAVNYERYNFKEE
jgi:hypothetical protein